MSEIICIQCVINKDKHSDAVENGICKSCRLDNLYEEWKRKNQ